MDAVIVMEYSLNFCLVKKNKISKSIITQNNNIFILYKLKYIGAYQILE